MYLTDKFELIVNIRQSERSGDDSGSSLVNENNNESASMGSKDKGYRFLSNDNNEMASDEGINFIVWE